MMAERSDPDSQPMSAGWRFDVFVDTIRPLAGSQRCFTADGFRRRAA
jgi:hypothetical protein